MMVGAEMNFGRPQMRPCTLSNVPDDVCLIEVIPLPQVNKRLASEQVFSGTGRWKMFENWRRDRDSNPGYPFEYTRFPSVRLQPLGHLSVGRLVGKRRDARRSPIVTYPADLPSGRVVDHRKIG